MALSQDLKRKLYLIAGLIFLVLGILGMFLPFLQGFLFLFVALVLLSRGSTRVQQWRQRFHERYPKWGERVDKAEDWLNGLPGRIKGWFSRRRA